MSSKKQQIAEFYDVIVIGGGPIGLATAYECAKAQKKVLVLEKSVFFNQYGSSGDMVRMFRTAYTEDFMAKLAYQSMPLWDAFEAETQTVGKLRDMSGLLNFGDPHYGEGGPEGTLLGPIPNLDHYGLKYTKLNREQIMAQHPFKDLPESWIGLDMPDNGTINVNLLTRTLYKLCAKLGVDLVHYAEVQKIYPDSDVEDRWVVAGRLGTDMGASADTTLFEPKTTRIAITSGAFVNHVLWPSFGFTFKLDIWEMVSAYYSIDPQVSFPRMWFQFAEDTPIKGSGTGISNLFYGFPSVPWGPSDAARIAVDAAKRTIKDPDYRSPDVIDPSDLENTRQFVMKHIRGIGPNPSPFFAGQCLQTNVYDNMFVLDTIPEKLIPGAGPARSNSIAVFTAGWAMKFVPLIGLVMKQLLVDGEVTDYDISHFKMDRTGKKKEEYIVQQTAVDRSA